MTVRAFRGGKEVPLEEILDDPAHRYSQEIAALEQGLRAIAGSCERCGCPDGVEVEGARTAYVWDGTGSNPNRRSRLCRPCAKEHHEFWDEMWSSARQAGL